MIIGVADSTGIYDTALRFGWMLALVGSALLIFLYLWRKNRLDMDEGPKDQMLQMDERHPLDDDEEKEK